jgi:hypothetical protein
MFTVDELSHKIAEYKLGRMSLQGFQNWFEDNSDGAYAVPDLREAYAAIEAALSEYYLDDIGQEALKLELAKAIRPFESSVSTPKFRLKPMFVTDEAIVRVGSSYIDIRVRLEWVTSEDFPPHLTEHESPPVRVVAPAV